MSEIKVTIDGSKFPPAVKFEVEGHKGSGCAQLSDEFNEVIKLETVRQTLKPEFKEVKQRLPLRR